MSVTAMAYVWKTKLKGTDKLMLLAIADRCDDDGVCFPGVDRLATKCSLKRRAAQKAIRRLEELGELESIIHGGIETGHGSTNRYVMTNYRKSIGIGVYSDTSLEKRGMNSSTSQGVYSSTHNPSVDSSVKEQKTVPATQDTSNSNKPKDETPIDWNDFVAAIGEVFKLYGPRGLDLANMLRGRSTKGEWKRCNLEVPSTPEEVRAFGAWYRRKHPDIDVVKVPMKVHSAIMEYRVMMQSQTPQSAGNVKVEPPKPSDALEGVVSYGGGT